jgi:hypothetical protein
MSFQDGENQFGVDDQANMDIFIVCRIKVHMPREIP